MGCNCGKKRLMAGNTSVNMADTQGSVAPDRPDIAAAKAEAEKRVEAARTELEK